MTAREMDDKLRAVIVTLERLRPLVTPLGKGMIYRAVEALDEIRDEIVTRQQKETA